ncbi:hypothetical protein ACIZ62_06070 [Acetobacterium carbinolicum]|uniref:hypothetical protein n=1 Tax=Acetobacterium carbinolicum TaxID=52690 RepID=UPI0039BF127B
MSFKTNKEQQLTLDDRFLQVDERTKKFVLNFWAKGFHILLGDSRAAMDLINVLSPEEHDFFIEMPIYKLLN